MSQQFSDDELQAMERWENDTGRCPTCGSEDPARTPIGVCFDTYHKDYFHQSAYLTPEQLHARDEPFHQSYTESEEGT